MGLLRRDPVRESAPDRAPAEPTERTLRALERMGIPRTPPPGAQEHECGDTR